MKNLTRIAGNRERTILGLMSGTSMDGLDLALCRVRGDGPDTEAELLHSGSVRIEKGVSKWFRMLAYRPGSGLGEVLKLESDLTSEWIRIVTGEMERWGVQPDEVDLIASHGQTILHQPGMVGGRHATWQIVDGDDLAAGTGIIVVSDFRRKHIAAGYEGAPLAPLAESLLFPDQDENRVLLNLGGIANITILRAGSTKMELPFASDTGPANTLIDEAVIRLMPGQRFDPDGSFASRGEVDRNVLDQFLRHPFFRREFPKSTGQEEFNWKWVDEQLLQIRSELKTEDLLATLTELTAVSVSKAVKSNLEGEEAVVYVSGGGWNNRYLIERLRHHLKGMKVGSSAELGVEPEIKEAVIFCVLANEAVAGKGWLNRNGERFTLGKFSFPLGAGVPD